MTAPTINAIGTRHAGCHFRSRLEARWAVYFDSLGIAWQYEPQGFTVGVYEGENRPYLPDFHLPDLDLWVEVKGDQERLDWALLGVAVDGFAQGLPRSSMTGDYAGSAIIILGDIPRPDAGRWTWPLVYNRKGARCGMAPDLGAWPIPTPPVWSWDHDRGYFDATWSGLEGEWEWHWGPPSVHGEGLDGVAQRKIQMARTAARSARFEHGERP